MKYDELKDKLVSDLSKKAPMLSTPKLVLYWSFVAYAMTVSFVMMTGPLRPGWSEQLASSPRFLIEFIAGLVVSPLCVYVAAYLNRPHEGQFKDSKAHYPLFALIISIGLLAVSIFLPAFDPSEIGYRPHCLSETLMFSIPPLIIWLFLARGGYSVRPIISGLLLGVAAASPAAMAMHIACKYDPLHMLIFHYGPVGAVSVISATIFWLIRR